MTSTDQALDWCHWLASRGVTLNQAEMRAMFTSGIERATELEESNAQVSAWKTEAELMCHKVITCGIIAEGKEHLNPIYQRGGKWDSQQADKVRELRAQLAAASERESKYREALEVACIASCECMTKTPDPDFHSESCRYKRYRAALTYNPNESEAKK